MNKISVTYNHLIGYKTYLLTQRSLSPERVLGDLS